MSDAIGAIGAAGINAVAAIAVTKIAADTVTKTVKRVPAKKSHGKIGMSGLGGKNFNKLYPTKKGKKGSIF